MDIEIFNQQAAAMGVSLAQPQLQQLHLFAQLLRKWNKTFNLVSRRDIRRLEQRHLLDSLTALPFLQPGKVLDIGSGAGLPGIPLAVAAPDSNFTLCDRRTRPTRFLYQVVQALALDNVSVVTSDVKQLLQAQDRFHTVVARGVATAPVVWDMVQSLLDPAGCVVVFERTQQQRETQPDKGTQGLGEAELADKRMFENNNIRMTRHSVDIPGLAIAHSLLVLERA